MKLTTTKTFAKYLCKKIPEYHFSKIEMTEKQFALYVDYNTYNNEQDYNFDKNCFSVIRVEYPYEYYANPNYITTRLLTNLYKKSNNNVDTFIKLLKEEIEI